MTNMKLIWMTGFASLAAAFGAIVMTAAPTSAETIIDINAASVQQGVQVQIGECPCFRWKLKGVAAGGKIETDEILISSEGLVNFEMTNTADFQKIAAATVTVGAAEVLIKGGHIGVGFNGVTYGQDPDMGYENMLRTGFYILANMVKSDYVQFDAHLGMGWDHFVTAVMTGDESYNRFVGNTGAKFKWEAKGGWSGTVSAHVGLDFSHDVNPDSVIVGGEATVRARIVSFSHFELGVNASLKGEHDGLRSLLGLNPNNGIGSLLMDLTWVEGVHTN